MISVLLAGFCLSAQAAKPSAPMTLKLDTQKSKAIWTGKKISGFHTGFVQFKEGSFVMKKGVLTSGEVVVDMTSLTDEDLKGSPENKAKIEGHLKGPDFFNIEKYPTAEFKFKSFEEMKPFAPGGPNAIARGDRFGPLPESSRAGISSTRPQLGHRPCWPAKASATRSILPQAQVRSMGMFCFLVKKGTHWASFLPSPAK